MIIAVTSIISLTALFAQDGQAFYDLLQLDKLAVADGEYWRLWSVTLLHGDLLHLAFNMYALYLAGTIVERWYGSLRFLRLLPGLRRRGLGGELRVRRRHPVGRGVGRGLRPLRRPARRRAGSTTRSIGRAAGIVSQLMFLVVINIVFGFASGGSIDNAAHLGGLAAGLWLGALVPPTGVPTMSSLWQRREQRRAHGAGIAKAPGYILLLALAVVAIVVVAGLAVGTSARLG